MLFQTVGPGPHALVCIDGSDDDADDPGVYTARMRNSFCNRAYNLALKARKLGKVAYVRGPTTLDWDRSTSQVLGEVMRLLEPWRGRPPSPGRLFLAGYSRGGLVAAVAARTLAPAPVEALFLFDAVDRSARQEAAVVSANVQHVYHVRRDPNYFQLGLAPDQRGSFNLQELDEIGSIYNLHPGAGARIAAFTSSLQTAGKVLGAGVGAVGSLADPRPAMQAAKAQADAAVAAKVRAADIAFRTRNWMGNAATSQPGGKNFEMKTMMGSHGAMGGVPWKDKELFGGSVSAPMEPMCTESWEELYSNRVWEFMAPRFRKHAVF